MYRVFFKDEGDGWPIFDDSLFSHAMDSHMKSMLHYVLIFSVAGAITFLVVPTIRYFALQFSIIDRKGDRKIHNKVVTRFGGLAMYIGFAFSMIAACVMEFSALKPYFIEMATISIGATLMLVLGIYDDAKGAGAVIKFSVQTLAALLLVNAGFVIKVLNNPFGPALELGVLSIPVTILWLVGVTNAINLIDGLDGLAAGIVGINAITLFFIYLFAHMTMPTFFAAALVGACLGFLPYNFSPAKVFMGDTGSLFLGFSIAALSILTEQKSTMAIGLLIPIIGLGIPILDTLLAFTRRLINGNNPFRADRKHIHHWLLNKKLSDRQSVLILWSATALLNIIAFLILFKCGLK